MDKKYHLDFTDEALFWTLYCDMVENDDIEMADLLLKKHPEMLRNLEKDIPGVEFTDNAVAWNQFLEMLEKK